MIFLLIVCISSISPDFEIFPYDPSGELAHFHLLESTEYDFFSVSNPDERCNASSAFEADVTHPVVFTQHREQTEPVKTRTYLGPCPAEENTFAYLNSSIAGKVLHGSFVFNCTTEDNIPDDSLRVLPHSRDQACVFAARLRPERRPTETATLPLVSGAVFKYKQLVSHGFSTKFTFILAVHPVLGVTKYTTKDAASYGALFEGDLFFFAVFNDGSVLHGTAETLPSAGLYVGVSVRGITLYRGQGEGELEPLAFSSTDLYPDLVDRRPHFMHVTYSTDFSAEEAFTGVTIEPSYHEELGRSERLGLFTVSLDGKRILATVIDLVAIAQVDGVASYADFDPDYDESRPGFAWVGFLSHNPSVAGSTYATPSVDIVSWKFSPTPRCPGADRPARCSVTEDRPEDSLILRVRNIGRTKISLGAKYAPSVGPLPFRCENSQLDWDQQHAYFLGCERELELSPQAEQLWVSDDAQVRSLTVPLKTSEFRGGSGVFKRRSTPQYCVVEHKFDIFRFYFAQCDCEYCARVFDLMRLYAVFNTQMCSARFGDVCNCFEASQMTHAAYNSSWDVLSPVGGLDEGQQLLSFQKHTVCVGCKFDSHCNRMFKHALCVGNTAKDYRIGNPLVPDIENPGFQDWVTDEGRVLDGLIKGDVCDCKDSNGQVNSYVNMRNVIETNEVYLIRTLQRSKEDCFECLNLFEGAFCAVECGPSTRVTFLSHPSGQACSTCALSGVALFELNYIDRSQLIDCFYGATATGLDPWAHCDETARYLPPIYANASQLFNGVATHFLTECPGRNFDDFGAVCAPNVEASKYLSSQILSRFSALRDTIWSEEFTCMNAACNLVSRSNCYERLIHLNFSTAAGSAACTDLLGSGVQCHFENGPIADEAGVNLNKTQLQYGHTDAISADYDLLTLGKTLEVWTTVDAADDVIDMANGAYVKGGAQVATASSLWVDDYAPSRAFDGDLVTFWASAVSETPQFVSILEADLGSLVYVGTVEIHWQQHAIDFEVSVSGDGVLWHTLVSANGNAETVNVFSEFFAARYLRLTMTKASGVRGPGPNEGLYIYGVKELIANQDLVISHLKPISSSQGDGVDYPVSNAVDGDPSTIFRLPFGWQLPSRSEPSALVNVLMDTPKYMDSLTFRFETLLSEFTLNVRGLAVNGQPRRVWSCGYTFSAGSSCPSSLILRGNSDFVFTFADRVLVDTIEIVVPESTRELFGLREVEMFGKLAMLETGGLAAASSSTSSTTASFGFDGDLETAWSTSLFPASFMADAGECTEAAAVDVVLDGLSSATYVKVLVSDDCESFIEAGAWAGISESSRVILSASNLSGNCIRCARVDFAASAGSVALAEVMFIERRSTGVKSTVSSFTDVDFALDFNVSTVALGTGTGYDEIQMLVMSDANEMRKIWGYEVEFDISAAEAHVAAENVSFSFCANSIALATCQWTELHRVAFLSSQTHRVSVALPEVVELYAVMLTFESLLTASRVAIRSIAIFDGADLMPGSSSVRSSHGSWSHPVASLVDGNSSTLFVVNGSLSDIILITLGSDPNTPAFAQNVTVEFDGIYGISKNFDLLTSVDGAVYLTLAEFRNFTGQILYSDMHVFCSFIQLVLLPITHGDAATNLYGIRAVDVKISSSAQVGRSILAQSTADAADYDAEKAFDSDYNTVFLHNPGKLPSLTEFRMSRTMDISGVLFKWLNAPYTYSVEYAVVDEITEAKLWLTAGSFEKVGSDSIHFEQTMRDGFMAQFFRLNISEVKPYLTAPVAGLRELIVYTPRFQCDRTTCPCCFLNPQTSDYSIPPSRAFDGDFLTTWQTDASGASLTAFVAAGLSGTRIGKVEIHWGTLKPKKFQLIIDTAEGYRVDDYIVDNNLEDVYEKYLLYDVELLTVMMLEAWPGDRFFQVSEVIVWAAGADAQPAAVVANVDHEFTASARNAIDLTSSFWMSQPGNIPGTSILDLGEVCKVTAFQIIWSLRPSFYNDDLFSYSIDGVDWIPLFTNIQPGSPEIEDYIGELNLRYLRIYLSSSYSDETSAGLSVWSVGIRNIDLKLDINLSKRAAASAPMGSWEFPPHDAFDNDESSYWMSSFGASSSTLTIDFGEPTNIAGIEVDFVYRARYIEFRISNSANCATGSYTDIFAVSGNQALSISAPSTIHARAKCVRAYFEQPLDQIIDPKGEDPQGVIGVRRFGVFNHKGGGGVFGIEECTVDSITSDVSCGRRFDSIVYGLTQPRRWEMASEVFDRTKEISGITVLERVSELVHIVAVFDNSTVTLYRNGVPYGAPYTHTSAHVTSAPSSTSFLRLVFGVRSSAFVGESTVGGYSESLKDIAGPPTSHSQYYSGVINSVSLIKGAVLAEEVAGLYEAGFNGGTERACHCADVCPFGFNKLYPDIPVPCSGQGVCRRDPADLHVGFCQCVSGYSGSACQDHCSDLGGCCNFLDDCEFGKTCDLTRHACVAT